MLNSRQPRPLPRLQPRMQPRIQPLAVEARMLFDGAGAVAAVNHEPVAIADCRTLTSDSTICDGQVISGNNLGDGADSDADGDALRVAGVDTGAPGSLPQSHIGEPLAGVYGTLIMQADGSYSYTPNADLCLSPGQSVTDTFTYTLCDNRGGEASTTLNLTIAAPQPNHDPTAMSDARLLEHGNTAVSGNAINGSTNGDQADSDVDGDWLTIWGVAAGNIGSAAPGQVGDTLDGVYGQLTMQQDGSYTYTRYADVPVAAGEQVRDVFTYTLCDQRGGLSSTTVSFAINGAPVVTENGGSGSTGGNGGNGGGAGGGGDNGTVGSGGNGGAGGGNGGSDAINSVTRPDTSPVKLVEPITATSSVVVSDPRQGSRLFSPALPSSAFVAPLLASGLSGLSSIRPSAAEETLFQLPRDAFSPFSPERVLGVIQEAPADALKLTAADKSINDSAPVKDDCVQVAKPMADKVKPKAVKPSVFAKADLQTSKSFSEQINVAKKAFKPPVKVRAAALPKDC